MIDLRALPAGRPYAVLGLGRSGRAATRALLAAGHKVWAWDDDPQTRESGRGEKIPIVDLRRRDLREPAALVLSPGIPHRYPAPHPIVCRAQNAGCPVVGDGELFARAHPEAACVGITGTNGKSTTTALIGHVLNAAHRPCVTGGNLGTAVLALDAVPDGGLYVLEMSSYQLELTPSLLFQVAVLLNITPDHLDRHGGMKGYVAAKRAIFRRQGPGAAAIVGVDDDFCRTIAAELAGASSARVIPVSGRAAVELGVYAIAGTLYDNLDGTPRPVLDLAEAPSLPGEHNAQNAAAAYAVARALGLDVDLIRSAIRTFPGLAHRQERIAAIDGVVFVNDSKATNADAAARALACYGNVYWIGGGRPKEGGLEALRPYLPRIRHAFLIGEAMEGFAAWLDGLVPFTRCGTLDVAVAAAAAAAAAADPDRETERPVVLLSPACASFDQFASFEARGKAFCQLVEALR
ncbi:MAG: UDP-N-acetylmuramoyl-L-alanine--D-glutamate ligase [Rhodospirillales bacterium]|nr:UDP-N-acetylmuramoyl-L-alanine--D-glutamate ligase [Rhodospirillales bacterium]